MSTLDHNKMECARCGGIFDYELTECPHCGVNIYFPDDENRERDNETLANTKKALRFPFAVIAGWFITAFIGFLLYIPIRFALTTSPPEIVVVVLATVSLSIGAFAGGFIFIRANQEKSRLGGSIQIVFSVVLGVLVFLSEGDSALLLSPLPLLGLLGIGFAAFSGIRVAENMLREAMLDGLFAPVVESQKIYQELLSKINHDHLVAERLIEHEREYTPKAMRHTLIENAIKRWNRDNRVN